MVRPHIHFTVTLTLNLWQWFPRFSPWKRGLFPNFITTLSLVASQIGYVIATSEPADSRVSILSLLTFTKDKYHQPWAWWRLKSVMSLRPLNQQTAKSQPRACWHLQKTGLNHTCWHLQKASITPLVLWGLILRLVTSQSVMSQRPLNR